MKLTRRKLATVLVSATAMAAQQPTPVPTATAADPLTAARDRLQANARALANTPIPMDTEPAFQFKA